MICDCLNCQMAEQVRELERRQKTHLIIMDQRRRGVWPYNRVEK
jgi:hypothetical protein